jgi:uridylate kinase
MTNAKIRLKVGSMELEYEGDPSFLTGGIETLLTTMGELSTRVPVEPTTPPAPLTVNVEGHPTGSPNFSTNTIAAHLDAKTGPELIICAMANIELVQQKSSSTRAEILAEMKNATTYFNENMRSNMGKNLSNLTRSKRINQVAKDTYALSATERKQVEVKVAEIG